MPAIALDALEQGLDTPSLRILAGLTDEENEFVLDRYLKDTLNELSIELPDTRRAAIEVGLAITDEIIDGKRQIFEGVQDICKAIDTYSFLEETKQYCYDSISFEKAYGLFWTIDDLKHSETDWQFVKTNQQLIEELKLELLTEIKIWYAKMKNGS